MDIEKSSLQTKTWRTIKDDQKLKAKKENKVTSFESDKPKV